MKKNSLFMGGYNVVLFTIFILQLSFVATSQPAPLKQWDLRYGGTGAEGFHSILQTADGGYILGGNSNSGINGDKTQTCQDVGFADYWIVKTDANGVKQWDKRFGGDGIDFLFSLNITADGGYIMGGRSTSGATGDKTQPSQGGSDYWIVKTDSNGTKQWDARFGGSGEEWLFSVYQTADGGFILGGYSGSGISGDRTQASWGGMDYWVVKTDANGVKQWDKRYGGNFDDYCYSLSLTNDGGYILGGESGSGISGDKTQDSQGGLGHHDYWIVKTDASGVKQWDARFGGFDFERLNSVLQTTDGGYILGGFSNSGNTGDKTQANWNPGSSTYDYWIVKTDVNGVKLWDARYGGTNNDVLYSLQQTIEGGYILGGYSSSGISGDKTQANWNPGSSTYDYWIVRTDANGVKLWDARYGGYDDDFLFSICQTTDGGYILGGYSETAGVNGDKTQANWGFDDYWIVKLDADCVVPVNLLSTNITATSAKLKWNAVPGAIKYKLRYKIANTNTWTTLSPVAHSKTINGLSPGTAYKWQVRTVCQLGPDIMSDWSPKQDFTTTLRLADEPTSQPSFQLYPNPAQDQATIQFTLAHHRTSP